MPQPQTEKVRINIRTAVNAAGIRRETRNGRDKWIVPSATLPDDVIMNGVKYPAAEIAKAFKSLEDTPAPFGHPMINGQFVSASHPEGINMAWIGAHNENARQETMKDGRKRVLVDKVIDIERANENEKGRMVLAALEKGDPIHTSTGLFCNLNDPDGKDHESIAVNMFFDHDAILLDEEGAATPKQGVGIFVNSSGKKEEVTVLNMTMEEELDEQIAWSAHHLATAMDKRSRLPQISEIKSAIFKAIGYNGTHNANDPTKETDQMADDKQLETLTNGMAEVKTAINGIADAVAKSVGDVLTEALKPMVEAQNQAAADAKAKEEAELAGYRDTIVKANVLSKEAAETLSLAAAKEMAANAKKPKAAALNSAFGGGTGEDDEFADVDFNANIDKKKEA